MLGPCRHRFAVSSRAILNLDLASSHILIPFPTRGLNSQPIRASTKPRQPAFTAHISTHRHEHCKLTFETTS
jgi:hypothetical protein